MLERAVRRAHAERAFQQQRVCFAHVPHHGLDRVATQRLERGDAFMAVDDEVAVGLMNDDEGRLLAGFSQRRDEAALLARVADPEAVQAAVQLMKFQRLWHGSQYAPVGIRSFSPGVGCCQEPYWDQRDSGRIGLSRRAGVVGT